MDGNALIKTFHFKFSFKQDIEGTVLGDSEENAKQLLIDEFGEIPEFEIFELVETDQLVLPFEEEDEDDEFHIVN